MSATIHTLPEPAVALRRRWQSLIDQPEGLPDTEAGDNERDRLCNEWCDIVATLADTPAQSLNGVTAKLRILAYEMSVGSATDGRDERLLHGAIADIERLSVPVRGFGPCEGDAA
jgi:hypothetical protein